MNRKIIVPLAMKPIVERAGYAPAVRFENLVFCAGQVGRDTNMNVINDPEKQFEACWDNLATVLSAAGCSFEDVVEMTTYHVGLQQHIHTFRKVKDRIFPAEHARGLALASLNLPIPVFLWKSKLWQLYLRTRWNRAAVDPRRSRKVLKFDRTAGVEDITKRRSWWTTSRGLYRECRGCDRFVFSP